MSHVLQSNKKGNNIEAPAPFMRRALSPHASRRVAPWLLFFALAATTWLLPPMPQPAAYHRFADDSICFGVPHCFDTMTNLLFVLAGTAGLAFLAGRRETGAFQDRRERLPYALFFGAVIVVGCASAYYHLAPDNGRLLWDRMAVAGALMAWFAAIVCERADVAWGRRLLPVLLLAGVGSAAYWGWSESVGHGDLRAYGLMQLMPFLCVPLLLRLYPPRYSGDRDVLLVLGLYLLALLCDFLDRPIAAATGSISGHTLKHVLAASAACQVIRGLHRRRPVGADA